MKRLLLLVGACALLMGAVYTPGVGPGPLQNNQAGGKGTVLLDLPLSSNGVTGVDDLPSTVPAPDVLWAGWNPLVNLGSDGGTFAVAAGATTAVDTPFCPNGTYDLTTTGDPASNNCLQARAFDGADLYNGAGLGDVGTGDFSVCTILRGANSGQVGVFGCQTNDANNYGWQVIYRNIWGTVLNYKTSLGAAGESAYVPAVEGWHIGCGSFDYDGNVIHYANTVDGGTTAMPGGDASSSDGFKIGDTYGYNAFQGDILAVYFWDDVALSAAQVKAFTWYWMGLVSDDDYEEVPTNVSSAGQSCCWVDGELECYGDDFAVVGCEVPPGMTGAGAEGGYYAGRQVTNSFLNSRDLSANWTEVGVGTLGATSTSVGPFRDGRQAVQLVTDDSAAAEEHIYQDVDITALNTGDKITLVVYARTASGSEGIDAEFEEAIGGGCIASSNGVEAVAITTDWKMVTWTHTVVDGDCTTLSVEIAPVSGAHPADHETNAETGSMYMMAQLFLDWTTAPSIYIETAAAAASAGRSVLAYSNTLTQLAISATSKDTYHFHVTPFVSDMQAPATYGCFLRVFGTNDVFMRTATKASPEIQWNTSSGANAHSDATPFSTQGTTYELKFTADWSADVFAYYEDNVLQSSSSNAEAAPADIDSLVVGNATTAGDLGPDGALMKDITIIRYRP